MFYDLLLMNLQFSLYINRYGSLSVKRFSCHTQSLRLSLMQPFLKFSSKFYIAYHLI